MTTTSQTLETPASTLPQVQARVTDRLAGFSWWVLLLLLTGVLLVYNFSTNETYNTIIRTIGVGLGLTVAVTITAYSFAILLGLLTALGQLSEPRFSTATTFGEKIRTFLLVIFRNLAILYVQVIRGVPIIVQIFYVALVVIPVLGIPAINWMGVQLAEWGLLGPENGMATLSNRDVNFVIRGIVALAISYGAFSSEIFRAGIQSIEIGQIEAAQALGLSWFKVFRHIIFPQALRRILPPLGNDFIAMLKESSLVSVLGVQEITQLGRKYASSSFLFAQTYNTLAFLYLCMTLILSMGVRYIERNLKTGGNLIEELFSFEGRTSRRTFWSSLALVYAVSFAAVFVISSVLSLFWEPDTGVYRVLFFGGSAIVAVLFLWANIAVQVKRWHDRDKSGWWALINVLPIVGQVWTLFENGALEGTSGSNQYGPDPLQTELVEIFEAEE